MNILYRIATKNDLERLVTMLADDLLGTTREDTRRPLNPKYLRAFAQITGDHNNELIVLEVENEIVGMFQLTFISYLTHTGSKRCLIEGVRINAKYRGISLGKKAIQWAIERARERGCSVVQLTSDKKREDAIRFYNKLGFEATHEGLKLRI